jgi:hypothetical protein
VYTEFIERAKKEMPVPEYFPDFRNGEYLVGRTIEVVRAHPIDYLSTYFLGLNTLWFSNNYHYFLYKYGFITLPESRPSFSMILAGGGPMAVIRELWKIGLHPYVITAILGKLLWLILVFGSLLGAGTSFKNDRNVLAFTYLLLVIYFSATILSTGIGVEQRHRYPLNPLIFIFFTTMAYSFYEKYLHRYSGPQ